MKILFIDTETGGLDAEKHSLLTIALAVYSDGEIIAEKDWAVKHKDYIVTIKALEVNKIDLIEHNKIAIESNIVVQEIMMFIFNNFGNERPIIAGHNVEFDNGFMTRLFKYEYEVWAKHVSHRKLDTCSLINYLIVTGRANLESASLEESIKHFKIEVNSRHTAKDDVRATIALFEKINKELDISCLR
jgi:DNA polymerase III epsilon subunit-like protein